MNAAELCIDAYRQKENSILKEQTQRLQKAKEDFISACKSIMGADQEGGLETVLSPRYDDLRTIDDASGRERFALPISYGKLTGEIRNNERGFYTVYFYYPELDTWGNETTGRSYNEFRGAVFVPAHWGEILLWVTEQGPERLAEFEKAKTKRDEDNRLRSIQNIKDEFANTNRISNDGDLWHVYTDEAIHQIADKAAQKHPEIDWNGIAQQTIARRDELQASTEERQRQEAEEKKRELEAYEKLCAEAEQKRAEAWFPFYLYEIEYSLLNSGDEESCGGVQTAYSLSPTPDENGWYPCIKHHGQIVKRIFPAHIAITELRIDSPADISDRNLLKKERTTVCDQDGDPIYIHYPPEGAKKIEG